MKKYMCLSLTTIFLSLIWIGCSNTVSYGEDENSSWVFVANEGNMGQSNGTISMIDDFGKVYETEPIGDVVQSLEVYGNKLIVLLHNSHKIIIYNITEDGLSMPGIEIPIDNSSPRDLTVLDVEGIENDKVYFTNWGTPGIVSPSIKVFNLFNYTIETSIPVSGLPEDIIIDGDYLWVTIPMNPDWSNASSVLKIDINSSTIIETIEVGAGPQEIVKHNGDIYISRKYSSTDDWTHGATKIIGPQQIIKKDFGSGGACGGSILSFQSNIYRSFEGGMARMDNDLNLDLENKIGAIDQSLVLYNVEVLNGNIWFAIVDKNYSDWSEIRIIDFNGHEVAAYTVGILPGDFAYWHK